MGGVFSTAVGYAGGKKAHPTYHDLGDHTETLEISYDPRQLSFEEILHEFAGQHDMTARNPRQYQSAIFYHDDDQREAAERFLDAQQARTNRPIATRLEPAGTFWRCVRCVAALPGLAGGLLIALTPPLPRAPAPRSTTRSTLRSTVPVALTVAPSRKLGRGEAALGSVDSSSRPRLSSRTPQRRPQRGGMTRSSFRRENTPNTCSGRPSHCGRGRGGGGEEGGDASPPTPPLPPVPHGLPAADGRRP